MPPTISRPQAAQSVLSASVKGTSFLILVQVVSRALTFAINQLLLRFLSPQLLGVSLQLELYAVSILYFARESVRVATQRQQDDAPARQKREGEGSTSATATAIRTQEIVNIAYIPICLGVPLAWALGALYLSKADEQVLATPRFAESLLLYGVAAMLELLTEPCFMVLQQRMLYKTRAVIETAATILKCFLIFGFTVQDYRAGRQLSVLPFAFGQVGFAVTMLVSYFWVVGGMATSDRFSLLAIPIPSVFPNQYFFRRFPKPLMTLSANMYLQAAVKHVLTQGDTLILAMFSTLSDQGLYGLASNYGGLIARMVFQPIEESSRSVFGKLLSASNGATKPSSESTRTALDYLYDVLRLYGLVSVVACFLGPTVFPQAFRLLIGSRWASTNIDTVLSTYCYYIPFLAVNGISEAFVSSVASNKVLRNQSMMMVLFTLFFAGAAWMLLRVWHFGAQGLVWANIANMALRTSWSIGFIKAYFAGLGEPLSLHRTLPTLGTMTTAVAAGAILKSLSINGGFRDLVKSGGVSICCVCLIIFFERQQLLQYYHKFVTGYPKKL